MICIYSEYADLNKYIVIHEYYCVNVIVDQASPKKKLVKAARQVGIASKGLNNEWIDQELFDRAAVIINPDQSSIIHRQTISNFP